MTIHVVAGPPASGKTSLVAARMALGDVVYDLDHLAAALTLRAVHARPNPLPLLLWLRDQLVNLAEVGQVDRLWLIASAPTPAERRVLSALGPVTLVLCHPATSLARTANRPPGEDWAAVIDGWWRRYRPGDADELITTDHPPTPAEGPPAPGPLEEPAHGSSRPRATAEAANPQRGQPDWDDPRPHRPASRARPRRA